MIGWVIGGVAAAVLAGFALNESEKKKLRVGDRAIMPVNALTAKGGLSLPSALAVLPEVELLTIRRNDAAKTADGTIAAFPAFEFSFPIQRVTRILRNGVAQPGGL